MLKIQAQSHIPTDFGMFTVYAFSENEEDWSPHLVWVAENTDFSRTVNVRFHSECITGEVFHSKKCECGQQLDAAMKFMSENGGIIIYLRQEGRNIGIINKLKAYALQEEGFDTVEANLKLGLPADGRNFDVAIEMLKILKVDHVNLLTNNPEKLKSLENTGIVLGKRIPLEIDSNEVNEDYLITKKDYFGHLLEKL
ncbi:GTP cyclohydrolase II [Chryseobacterium carnipullorum]|uniref:GTP cyclohydrolase-2 n=1 Tax=Chryseobacterium carnipullorum TaxID=1124835 RepID=A0A376DUG0_CHRCU|nr:GTP cyclohydrolase II [Chryseobacterium carnipullorum]MDN5396808.1 GTP cyclohydrolase II [Chryseobacterium sp.]AZA49829.1 GTP cyclohydrolase II [Chryseobacterium carnipullorum]AZA64718.1 GTP cyclohydrolase II [Chryseobacterium carnipullorum]MDN5478604.1 GTP cyclohydrolase II [Chryseobacterium sp.]STC95895.1 Riboflavin biosynthesis protein ribBA [Chryseobacterium carnipullorum]